MVLVFEIFYLNFILKVSKSSLNLAKDTVSEVENTLKMLPRMKHRTTKEKHERENKIYKE